MSIFMHTSISIKTDPRDPAAASTLVLELDLKPAGLTCGAGDGRASSSSNELSLAFAAKLSSVRSKIIFFFIIIIWQPPPSFRPSGRSVYMLADFITLSAPAGLLLLAAEMLY